MKRFLITAMVGVLALGLSSAAYANFCAFDPVPASTLLFPFVAYDYNGGNDGQTTLFAITNVSSEAQIVHITVWSDFSVAVLDFNLTLTGYDVQTINIRDILDGGYLPTYDPDGDGGMVRMDNIWAEDNEGGVFDTGPWSTNNTLVTATLPGGGLDQPQATWDGYTGTSAQSADWWLRCNPDDLDTVAIEGWISSPINYVEPIDEGTLGLFKLYLQSSQTADKYHATCDYSDTVDFDTWFVNRSTDDVTWMYITADVVWACNKDLPDGALDYFADPLNPANNGLKVSNVIVGDQIWLDRSNNYSEADSAVHIEAFPGNFGNTQGPFAKNVTFYHRYHTDNAGFFDYREPLPTAWSLRYFDNAGAMAYSWVRAWKGVALNGIVPDLYGPNVESTTVDPAQEPDPICLDPSSAECVNPSELYSNSCAAYTVYIWDENEGVNLLDDPGAQGNPWSGGDPPSSTQFEIPNLLPLETQEVPSNQFYLVDDFGWMMFIWPLSNGDPNATGDLYQTWMGAKYQAFGQYSAALTGQVLANFNCFAGQTTPLLGIGRYTVSE